MIWAPSGSVHAATGRQQPAEAVERPDGSPYRALLDQFCVNCHSDRQYESGSVPVSLQSVDVARVGTNPQLFEKVVRKVRAGVMPPSGRRRPDKARLDAFAAYLETSLDRVAAAAPNPGRPDTFRRLSRAQYHNAVRDLLALEIDVTELLPADDSSYGFDHISVGGLSPTLLERYLKAADKVSHMAVGAPVRSPVAEMDVLPSDFNQDDHIEGLPFGTRGGTLVSHFFPLDAEYEIQVRLGRNNDAMIVGRNEPHELEVTLDGKRLELFAVLPEAPGRGYGLGEGNVEVHIDAAFNVRVPVKAGPRVVGVAFLKKNAALVETARKPYVRPQSAPAEDHRIQPHIFSVTVAGPFGPAGPGETPSRSRIFSCRPAARSDEADCANRIVSKLARRAYRRPVTTSEVDRLLAYYRTGREEGDFETGIQMAIRRLLMVPEFLFRVERDPVDVAPDTAYRLSDLELATRLSFFLWSSIPDEELLDVATSGRLTDPAELEQQVRRMLADDRSSASLVTNFAAQWLYLRNLPAVRPNGDLFPDFDEGLRRALRRETELFFESILREDRSVLDLLKADYTFLNERLAKHYGIPDVYGSHFRRVTLGKDSVRGGLLGQGSVLTVTAYPNRTSPVLRGKWILENLLGTPPPPPPPNVPPLAEGAAAKGLSMRERMTQHRANPVCASCHRMMDPLGLALENFDAVGRWRTHGEGHTPIDASGSLPDGTTFEGVTGLREALLSQSELFVTTTTEKLLTYALARGLEYYDAPAVRAIAREGAPGGYRLSDLILGIVKSDAFQMRRSQS